MREASFWSRWYLTQRFTTGQREENKKLDHSIYMDHLYHILFS